MPNARDLAIGPLRPPDAVNPADTLCGFTPRGKVVVGRRALGPACETRPIPEASADRAAEGAGRSDARCAWLGRPCHHLWRRSGKSRGCAARSRVHGRACRPRRRAGHRVNAQVPQPFWTVSSSAPATLKYVSFRNPGSDASIDGSLAYFIGDFTCLSVGPAGLGLRHISRPASPLHAGHRYSDQGQSSSGRASSCENARD